MNPNNSIRSLSCAEIESVSGGPIVIATPILIATAICAIFAFGYEVGKDLAERDNKK